MVEEYFERAVRCPYCGAMLPKIQDRPSLSDVPYETCKSCGKVFIVVAFENLMEYLQNILPCKP